LTLTACLSKNSIKTLGSAPKSIELTLTACLSKNSIKTSGSAPKSIELTLTACLSKNSIKTLGSAPKIRFDTNDSYMYIGQMKYCNG